MYCKVCGSKIDDNSMFCPICGAQIQQSQQTNQQPQQSVNQQLNQQPQQGGQQYNQQPLQGMSQRSQQGYPQFNQQPQQGMNQQPQQGGQQYYQQPQQGGQQYYQPQQGGQQYNQQPQQGGRQYNQPPQQPSGAGKSNMGLIIGIICGAAVLCIALVLLFAFDVFGLRDKDDTDDVAEVTTEEVVDPEEDTIEETTEEVTTDSDVSTSAENESKPYGEEMGYVFSDPSDAGVKEAGYPKISDEYGNEMDIDCDEYLDSYGYEEGIDYIAVTDPDEDGNVTYVVKTHRTLEADFSDSPNGDKSFSWTLHCWLYDVSDYYTGTIIGTTGSRKGSVEDTEPREFEYNGETISAYCTRATVIDNGIDFTYDDSTGLYHDEYTRHYCYYITMPQDYDGLVMSVPKKYDHSTNKTHEDDPSIPENINDETSPLLDVDYYGYTTAEDTIFVRLSDHAVPFTPDMESKIMDAYDGTAFTTFSWYLDALDEKKNGDENIGAYNPIAGKITDPERLSGKWQALIVWDPDHKMDCFEKEYSMADITGSGSNVSITFNPKCSVDYGNNMTDISDRDSSSYSADMKDDGSIDFQPNGMAFTIDYFVSDGVAQYAFGNMILQDGTEGKVVLQRP